MSERRMAQRMAQARAFLHHGKFGRDYVGQWIYDALSVGTPVVSYGGIAKVRIENGQTGYIVPDEAAYGNLVVQLLGDDAFFTRQSEAARNSRREWAAMAAELEKL